VGKVARLEESMTRARFVIPTLVAALAVGVTLKRLGETHVDEGLTTAAAIVATPYTEASEHIARPADEAEPAPTF
jgi:hypothetical protein